VKNIGKKARGFMGVRVKERLAGSGDWWVFIQKHGQRKAKRVGAEKAAREAAEKIQAQQHQDHL
jgi:integrase